MRAGFISLLASALSPPSTWELKSRSCVLLGAGMGRGLCQGPAQEFPISCDTLKGHSWWHFSSSLLSLLSPFPRFLPLSRVFVLCNVTPAGKGCLFLSFLVALCSKQHPIRRSFVVQLCKPLSRHPRLILIQLGLVPDTVTLNQREKKPTWMLLLPSLQIKARKSILEVIMGGSGILKFNLELQGSVCKGQCRTPRVSGLLCQ